MKQRIQGNASAWFLILMSVMLVVGIVNFASGTPYGGSPLGPKTQYDATLQIMVSGGGGTISTGVIGYIEVPYDMTIERVTALADQDCTAVIDLWVDSYANYPPTDADSITASSPITITTSKKSQDTTLTGWTKKLRQGQIIGINGDANDAATTLTISLYGKRSS